MAIDITFNNFDTVCYSNQHNIIELINQAVNLGLQVNINISNIQQVQSDVGEAAQEAHDANLLATNLNERMSAVELRVNAMWGDTPLFNGSSLGARIKDIEDRLDALGG